MIVPIIMGSESDKEFVKKITDELDNLDLPHKEYVASAHKTPELVLEIVEEYNKSDEPVCFITVAGRSNGLSGVTAASSVHPVIACPPFKDKIAYSINIHSTLQMPSQTPVLTVLDPKNVALAVARILGLTDKELQNKVKENIKEMKESFKK